MAYVRKHGRVHERRVMLESPRDDYTITLSAGVSLAPHICIAATTLSLISPLRRRRRNETLLPHQFSKGDWKHVCVFSGRLRAPPRELERASARAQITPAGRDTLTRRPPEHLNSLWLR
jgi:hypothetical protein